MEVRVLGAHNTESKTTHCASLVIDETLAVDAGGLTSGLSFRSQMKLKAVLLTHRHFDHIRDIPFLAMNLQLRSASIDIYGSESVRDALIRYLMDGEIYPNFLITPAENPVIRFNLVVADKTYEIAGHSVTPISTNHSVPTLGYYITTPDGKQIFYTSDTGPGLDEVWHTISPQMLFIETTAPNKRTDFARKSKHLTPELLQVEMDSFRKINGYLPKIVLMHMNPEEEREIAAEAANAALLLGTSITLGREGMVVRF